MKQIPLSQGKVALVSDHRFEHLNQWKWHASLCGDKFYAVRIEGMPSHKTIYMHREIMNAAKSVQVDHRDDNGLNNQDDNLRICTKSGNMQNRGKQKNNTTGFKGVFMDKRRQRYFSRIGVDGEYKFLGCFADPIDAAKAYDEAAKELHGDFAWTNF